MLKWNGTDNIRQLDKSNTKMKDSNVIARANAPLIVGINYKRKKSMWFDRFLFSSASSVQSDLCVSYSLFVLLLLSCEPTASQLQSIVISFSYFCVGLAQYTTFSSMQYKTIDSHLFLIFFFLVSCCLQY